jgi:elongation factor 3
MLFDLSTPLPCTPVALTPLQYLDRDSLGALAAAIKEFQGGVVLITHHRDFTKELCSETWDVVDGIVTSSGAKWAAAQIEAKLAPDEVMDAAGNVIKVVKKLQGKELRKAQKEKARRRKAGEDVSDDDWE